MARQMLPRLWRDPAPDAPFMPQADYAARWWRDLPCITSGAAYDEAMVAEAARAW